MLDIVEERGERTVPGEHVDGGGTDTAGVLGNLRYLVGFVGTLVVYGLLPPIVTGASILYVEAVVGVSDPAPLIGVGVVVGVAVYGAALIADRGVSALTGPGGEDDGPVPMAPPE